MTAALAAQARAAGIDLRPRWDGAGPIPETTLRSLIDVLGDGVLAPDRPQAQPNDQAAPFSAYVPPILDRRRLFGVALQLYQLTSSRNMGIGDLRDLQALIAPFAAAGVSFIGLNPLHALFTAEPERASPFFPSDRRFLNPLIIAVDDVPGFCPSMRDGVHSPAMGKVVDYGAVAAAKLSILRTIHGKWLAKADDVPAAAHRSAVRFVEAGGNALQDFALFETLSHHFQAAGHGATWSTWPEAYRTVGGRKVQDFRQSHGREIAFHAWLQYIARSQVAAVHQQALDAGMAIGLYLDLAIGTAPDGAATWADPGAILKGARVGAPPDLFTAAGQDWGLSALSPVALRQQACAPYCDVLSAAMANAGAMRVDHAMGLERLYLIPDGATAIDGAYVAMPDLTSALVDMSHRHKTLAIGEDLGVVPHGFRERMGERRIFSMRILPFERDGKRMRPPGAYPIASLACLSTHDMAPLRAFWSGDDIATRNEIGMLTGPHLESACRARDEEKALLVGLAGLPPRVSDHALNGDMVVRLHQALARSASKLMAIRLEDVVGDERLVNLPGTDREYPNWRHTLPVSVDEIASSETLQRVFLVARQARGSAS